jgi:N-acetylated-alpha-linked acidic dipeptidase
MAAAEASDDLELKPASTSAVSKPALDEDLELAGGPPGSSIAEEPLLLQAPYNESPRNNNRLLLYVGLAVLGVIAFCALAVLLRPVPSLLREETSNAIWERQVLALANRQSIEGFHRRLALNVHIAGTPAAQGLASWILQQLSRMGFRSELVQYEALLSSPLASNLSTTSPFVYRCNNTEPPLPGDPYTSVPGLPPAFLAYSGNGTVESELVYVNYGTQQDFDLLQHRGVNLTGRLGIARLGQSFRGVKVMLAEANGLAGLILYPDPADQGPQDALPLPAGMRRPPESVERGSTAFGLVYPGDPQTPFRPSLPGAARLPRDHCPLPTIPVVPIGYGDARPLLAALQGALPLPTWQGGLSGLSYQLGPGPVRASLSVSMKEQVLPIRNVLASLEGRLFPDEWVVLGAHHDAWGYGAIDDTSAVAAVLETARCLSAIYKEGWRPLRSIKIALWDAEEFGLMGSTEWVEQFSADVGGKVVAYLNVDSGIAGKYFYPGASPLLQTVIKAAAAQVDSPNTPGQTLAEDHLTFSPLGFGGDFVAFSSYAGVPAANLRFVGDEGVYHSNYDTITYFEKYMDPTRVYSLALVKLLSFAMVRLGGIPILPYDLEAYPRSLEAAVAELQQSATAANLTSLPLPPNGHPLNLTRFTTALSALRVGLSDLAAKTIALRAAAASSASDATSTNAQIRALNARMRGIEQRFLLAGGLQGRPWYKHALMGPVAHDGYRGYFLPDMQAAVQLRDAYALQEAADAAADVMTTAAAYVQQPLSLDT